MKKVILLIPCLLLIAGQSFARGGGGSGWMLGLSLAPSSLTVDNPSPASDSNASAMELGAKFGMVMPNGVFLGGLYNNRTTSGDSTYPTIGSMGFAVGYHNNGFFADLGYLLSGTYETSSSSKLTEGTGIQIDLGYNAMINSNFFMGFQISYVTQNYKKAEVSGVTGDTDNKIASMGPMINLGLMF
ncbi:MAG TPA: hypothetical protein PLJ21_13965 [Pseudobdellovibrionaceae bacterium]|nr:hypothetical protein [Pseudobdellovibrionaceae bacterium]